MPTESVVVVLDVGRSMTSNRGEMTNLEKAIKAVSQLIRQKLLMQTSKDEIGVVIFGCSETDNYLNSEHGEGYEHVKVLRKICLPDLELLREIESIEPGGEESDLLDGLIVALDLQMRREEDKKKMAKRVFLVTDAGGETNRADIQDVINQFDSMKAALNIIGIDFKDDGDDDDDDSEDCIPRSEVKIKNEEMLKMTCNTIQKGAIFPVSEALAMLQYFRSRKPLQRAAFKGNLEIGESILLPIIAYLKTYEQKRPTFGKVSAVSLSSANPESMAVLSERTLHDITDPDIEVEPSDRVKGYKYGKSVVPFSKVDEEVLKYLGGERCLKVIGFCDAKQVKRTHYCGTSEFIVPDCSFQSEKPLSALVRALAETDSVCIARYVKRRNANPKLVVLSPLIRSTCDFLVLNSLPFVEDLRQYPFAPLARDRVPKHQRPTDEHLASVHELICSLDLSKAPIGDNNEKFEAFKPKYNINPTLQSLYQSIIHRAFHSEGPLPSMDATIAQYINPDSTLFEASKGAIGNCNRMFELHRVLPPGAKPEASFWSRIAAVQDGMKLDSYLADDDTGKDGEKKRKWGDMDKDLAADFTIEEIIGGSAVSSIGPINPVSDFRSMLSRRDIDCVEAAVNGMFVRINSIVNDSYGNVGYDKALECLIELRKGCVIEQEPEMFNSGLATLKHRFKGDPRRGDFWDMVVKKNVALISEEEADDSTVTKEQAADFLEKDMTEIDQSLYEPTPTDEVDELLGMVE